MKTTHVLTLAVLCLAAVALFASGDAEAAAPTIDEVFSTVNFPDYGVADFFEDLFGLGSALADTGSALSSYTDFIMNETFFNPDIGLSTLASKFFLVCFVVMIVCILMAVVSLLWYKREYVDQ
ncbi:MAG: hypothetical protein GX224_04910 [Thermoplasmatales archaeon]|nr:hypothetical protein [Thermoplasmatales archaeon]